MKNRAARRLAATAMALALCAAGAPLRAQTPAAAPQPQPANPQPASAAAKEQGDAADPDSDGSKQPSENGTASVRLPGVEVQGQRNPLTESDERLKKLTESLPCVGCDAKPVHPGGKLKKALDKAVDFAVDQVTPQPPRDHSHEAADAARDNAQQGQCIGAANVMQCVPSNANP
jgi:hypothetical protein